MLYKLARSLVKRRATSAPRSIPIVLRLARLILPHISRPRSLLFTSFSRSRIMPGFASAHMFRSSRLRFPLGLRTCLCSQAIPLIQTWTNQLRYRAEEFEGGRKEEIDIRRNSSWALYHLSCRMSTLDCPWSRALSCHVSAERFALW